MLAGAAANLAIDVAALALGQVLATAVEVNPASLLTYGVGTAAAMPPKVVLTRRLTATVKAMAMLTVPAQCMDLPCCYRS